VTHPQVRPGPAFGLLELYDDALPHVYGYLLARCGDAFRRIYEGEEGSR
jgi:RNA polymerase sigma-70 factor (ECF subfamily)